MRIKGQPKRASYHKVVIGDDEDLLRAYENKMNAKYGAFPEDVVDIAVVIEYLFRYVPDESDYNERVVNEIINCLLTKKEFVKPANLSREAIRSAWMKHGVNRDIRWAVLSIIEAVATRDAEFFEHMGKLFRANPETIISSDPLRYIISSFVTWRIAEGTWTTREEIEKGLAACRVSVDRKSLDRALDDMGIKIPRKRGRPKSAGR